MLIRILLKVVVFTKMFPGLQNADQPEQPYPDCAHGWEGQVCLSGKSSTKIEFKKIRRLTVKYKLLGLINGHENDFFFFTKFCFEITLCKMFCSFKFRKKNSLFTKPFKKIMI